MKNRFHACNLEFIAILLPSHAHTFNNIKDKHIFKTRNLHRQKCRVIIFLYIVPSYLCQPRGHPSICLLKSSNRFEGAVHRRICIRDYSLCCNRAAVNNIFIFDTLPC